jgi:hypothetical protein
MKHRVLALVTLACCLLCGTALAAPKLLQDIPLKWTPTQGFSELGPLDVSGPLLTTKVHFETFVDARSNPESIAENREKADARPVTTKDNVADFVTLHLKESVHGAGVTTVDDAGDVSISGEIRQFVVTETNLYHGDLSLLVHVKNSKGKEIWSGIIPGGAEHFGRSYKADNYYETLSDMVMRAAYNLLTNADFRAALQKH